MGQKNNKRIHSLFERVIKILTKHTFLMKLDQVVLLYVGSDVEDQVVTQLLL